MFTVYVCATRGCGTSVRAPLLTSPSLVLFMLRRLRLCLAYAFSLGPHSRMCIFGILHGPKVRGWHAECEESTLAVSGATGVCPLSLLPRGIQRNLAHRAGIVAGGATHLRHLRPPRLGALRPHGRCKQIIGHDRGGDLVLRRRHRRGRAVHLGRGQGRGAQLVPDDAQAGHAHRAQQGDGLGRDHQRLDIIMGAHHQDLLGGAPDEARQAQRVRKRRLQDEGDAGHAIEEAPAQFPGLRDESA